LTRVPTKTKKRAKINEEKIKTTNLSHPETYYGRRKKKENSGSYTNDSRDQKKFL